MALKKKLRIENATAFRLEYSEDGETLKSKEFKTLKAMEQFHNRQGSLQYMDWHRYAQIGGEWHRYIKLDSPFVFQSNLETLNKNFEDANLQKLEK